MTRGVGELTYDLEATPTPSVVIIVKAQIDPPPDAYEQGVRVVIVDIVRNHPGSVNPLIKSNNLMNSALAMQEAFRSGAFEGVMRNYRGELAECTTSNLFVIKNGTALTPPLDAGLLPGITREFVFDIGAEQRHPGRGGGPPRRRSVRRRRSVPHQHDAGDRPDRDRRRSPHRFRDARRRDARAAGRPSAAKLRSCPRPSWN